MRIAAWASPPNVVQPNYTISFCVEPTHYHPNSGRRKLRPSQPFHSLPHEPRNFRFKGHNPKTPEFNRRMKKGCRNIVRETQPPPSRRLDLSVHFAQACKGGPTQYQCMSEPRQKISLQNPDPLLRLKRRTCNPIQVRQQLNSTPHQASAVKVDTQIAY